MMEIITDDNMIGLNIGAKIIFIANILEINKANGCYNTLQVVKEDTLDKIKNMPIGIGFTQEIKDGTIRAFEKMGIGRKFLCLDKWIENYESDEAKLYWEVQRLCNNGYTLDEAMVVANNKHKRNNS